MVRDNRQSRHQPSPPLQASLVQVLLVVWHMSLAKGIVAKGNCTGRRIGREVMRGG